MRRPVAVVPNAPSMGWQSLQPPAPRAPGLAVAGELDGRRAPWHLFDELLPVLGPEGALEHLFLDGHMAALDDYLAAHPAAGQTLRLLTASGRLAFGPSQVLLDEYASSGETIIHNLQAGCNRVAQLGDAPRVALLPATWGHVAQLPQLLRQVGPDHVVVMAGHWPATLKSAFWWRAPDGSTVRAEYRQAERRPRDPFPMTGDERGDKQQEEAAAQAAPGRSPGGAGPEAGEPLVREAERLLRSLNALEEGPAREILMPGEAMLWLHQAELSDLVDGGLAPYAATLAHLVEIANASQGKYHLRVTPAIDYFEATLSDGLSAISGELCPPVGGLGPGAGQMRSWEGVFSGRRDLNAAAADAERGLELLGEPLCALWLPAGQWPEDDFAAAWDHLVRNAGARLTLGGQPADQGRRLAAGSPDTLAYPYAHVASVARAAQRWALANAAPAFRGPGTVVINPSAGERSGVVEVPAAVAKTTSAPVQILAGDRVLAHVRAVPGYGWATMSEDEAGGAAPFGDPPPVRADTGDLGEPSLDNGQVHLSISRVDGSFAINGHWGLDRLVDEDDAGDAESFERPASRHDDDDDDQGRGLTQRPERVEVEILEGGPLRGRALVVRRYPSSYIGGDVVTELELRAGENLVRVTTSFFNQRPGHRLRALLALPARAESSLADSAFACTERPTQPEASYPTKNFVCAAGLVVVHHGLAEYSVGSRGWVLALTLLRSTPWPGALPLSGGGGHLDPGAGDPTGWERASWPAHGPAAGLGPEQLGHHVVRYAVALGDPSLGPEGGLDPWRLAEEAFVPLQVVDAPGGGHLPPTGSHLQVSAPRVSALRRRGDRLELRVFNPAPEPVSVTLPGRRGELVDLRGSVISLWEDEFALAGWAIATVHISE